MQKKIAEEREIKAWISNLMRTTRLWDYFHQVRPHSKNWQTLQIIYFQQHLKNDELAIA